MRITKAIIPVAGLGTRFLPATKAQPKEMLPVVDKPIIQYIVEEAVAAGIKQIILITSQNKRALEDHFDRNFELEYRLQKKGDKKRSAPFWILLISRNLSMCANDHPKGTGTPFFRRGTLWTMNRAPYFLVMTWLMQKYRPSNN